MSMAGQVDWTEEPVVRYVCTVTGFCMILATEVPHAETSLLLNNSQFK